MSFVLPKLQFRTDYLLSQCLLLFILVSLGSNNQAQELIAIDDLKEQATRHQKDYLWVVFWVPSCKEAAQNFTDYVRLQKQYSDRLDLLLIAVHNDSLVFEEYSKKENYQGKIYVIDHSIYGKDTQRHVRLGKAIQEWRGMKTKRFYSHYLLARVGRDFAFLPSINNDLEKMLRKRLKKI